MRIIANTVLIAKATHCRVCGSLSWPVLFPETYIGDSEEVRGTTPAGKKHLGSQRDGRSVSPPSANSGQQDRENVASPRELEVPSFNQELPPEGEGHRDEETDVPGEEQLAPRCVPEEDGEGTQKPLNPQNTNLLGFRWLQGEEDDRDVRQENASNPLETVSGQETVSEGGGCEVLAVLWPPPGDNAEEHLEPRLNEVSLIDRFVPEEKLSPTLSRLGYPESSPGAQESPSPCDEEALRTESPASTGYFPCYRTYEELPCYRPNKQPEGPGRYRDAAVQCDRPEGATGREKRRAEAKKSLEEGKRPAAPPGSPQRQLPGGPRPASAGRRLEGPGRNPRASGESSPTRGPEARRPSGRSPSGSGTAKEGPGLGPRTSPSPPAGYRKSLQKKKHRGSPADEEQQSARMERKPLLEDQLSLPPSPEEKVRARPLCCYGAEAAGERRQVRPAKGQVKDGPQPMPPTPSPTSAPGPSGDPGPRPSRLSFHAIVSWVWRIFRKPAQAPPGLDPGRRPLGHRLRLWLGQRGGRVHPELP
ncbi:uncharacterized protein LOC110072541 isoform X2 [Pogona vitticeps]